MVTKGTSFMKMKLVHPSLPNSTQGYIYVKDSEGGIQEFADTTLNLLDLVFNIFAFAFAPK